MFIYLCFYFQVENFEPDPSGKALKKYPVLFYGTYETLAAQGFLLPLTHIVQLFNARVNQYSQSFIPFSGKLWNFLPVSVFPISYDLTSFKREV
ncbi:hypothetical protein E2C01_099590 [Portunus trituberculatus]|uniref:Uncharacterized protein n=1 Tax=Portunus trituberculatus TaxID=210409 RepID=A0A5B7K481_PORTR|nr:hypothetical protein [Portunus trituberculatus]